MNGRILVSIIIVFMLLFTVACQKREIPPPEMGNKAAPFTLKDTNGRTVRLSDFQGKVVIVDFWATWCHSCKESSQELEKLHAAYKGKDAVIVGISMDSGSDAVQQVKDFQKRYSLTYPVLMGNAEVEKSYAVTKIPVTYMLDRDHIIRRIYVGAVPELGKIIDRDIKELS